MELLYYLAMATAALGLISRAVVYLERILVGGLRLRVVVAAYRRWPRA